jgi:hypothetical protein
MQTAWTTHYELIQAGLAAGNNLVSQTWFTWGKAFSGTIETSSGNTTPAANAYNVVYGWLVGQQPQPCSNSGNIWSCQIGSNLVVWDTSQTCSGGICTTSQYTPPAGYGQYVDVTGTASTVPGTISLGVKPIMLMP